MPDDLKRWWLTVLVCILLGGGLTYQNFNLTYPIPAEADPYAYVEVAQSLANGRGFQYDGQELTTWPPLYPALIAVGVRAGLPVMQSVRLLHTLSFALVILLSARLVRRLLTDERLQISALLALTLNSGMQFNAYVTMSELVFVLLTLLLFNALIDERPAWQIGILAALLMLTRYAGVVVVPVVLFYEWRRWSIRDNAVFVTLALLPIALWLLHNAYAGAVVGARSDGNTWSLVDGLLLAFTTFQYWFWQSLLIAGLIYVYWFIRRWPVER